MVLGPTACAVWKWANLYAFRSFPFGDTRTEVWMLQSNKRYQVQFECSLETWLWLSIQDQGQLQRPPIFDKFSEATVWKWCLRPKNSGVIAQKIAPVIHNWCWHHSVDHWSVSSSLRWRNPVATSDSTRSISSHMQVPSWKMLSLAGVRYHTKLLSVKTAAGPKLALAMILLAWGAADLTLNKTLAKCLGCWYDGWQLGIGSVAGG